MIQASFGASQVVLELNFRRDGDPASNARKACGELVQKAETNDGKQNERVIQSACFPKSAGLTVL